MEQKDVKYSVDEMDSRMDESGQGFSEDMNTDENMAGTTHLNDRVIDQDELEKLKDELQGQKDKYLRLFAEFDNFRKRTAKERLDQMQTAGKEVIISMLDVLDDCDRAEKQLLASKDTGQAKEGVLLVFNKLRSVLQSKGLEAMESLHSDFDVEKQEAITEIPAPTAALKGKVVDVLRTGYYLNGKLIRFAQVVVGK